eukprot:CAMPEP_0117420606 /NCGR_PEP_ID=MMETSP0758-20121206/1902_1 /TAXON_ID=63605 /ORGANISM="Percolomonas cosmopolitus, Strain AE-1 (ATCC 50343)" /LENGTH=210 /DNA_ID=CAMNT_0005202307 /DNA_START=38 /DNA_END=670 /DNA_ORIENTATION=+
MATLGSGDLNEAVKTPVDIEEEEWLAVNTIDFFKTTNMLYGSISEFCTDETCPCMNAGDIVYFWVDPPKIKKPVKVTAPQYINNLMNSIEDKINDTSLFPEDDREKFPKKFHKEVKNIFRRMFRVYAHIYTTHFEEVQKLGEEAHLNTAFKHYSLFCIEFNFLSKEEFEPIATEMIKILGEDYRPLIEKKKKERKKSFKLSKIFKKKKDE